jgi:hypothetical protein
MACGAFPHFELCVQLAIEVANIFVSALRACPVVIARSVLGGRGYTLALTC